MLGAGDWRENREQALGVRFQVTGKASPRLGGEGLFPTLSGLAHGARCLLLTAPARGPKDRGLCPCGEPCSILLSPEGSKATRNSRSRNYREHSHQQGKEPTGLNLGV